MNHTLEMIVRYGFQIQFLTHLMRHLTKVSIQLDFQYVCNIRMTVEYKYTEPLRVVSVTDKHDRDRRKD